VNKVIAATQRRTPRAQAHQEHRHVSEAQCVPERAGCLAMRRRTTREWMAAPFAAGLAIMLIARWSQHRMH
jgi:hypothetical protein